MRIVVIGGGLVGRLVQMAVVEAKIYDWRRKPDYLDITRPPTFGAQYLWAPIPGIVSEPITVKTTVDLLPPEPGRIIAYKDKVGKGSDGGDWVAQFTSPMAGHRLVSMPEPAMTFGAMVTAVDVRRQVVRLKIGGEDVWEPYDHLVSTIPLYTFLRLVGKKFPGGAAYQPIYVNVVNKCPVILPPDTWLVNYWSQANTPLYRSTFRDGETHHETLVPQTKLGYKKIIPGKIYVTPEQVQPLKEIREWLASCSIWLFGRYGAWNPDELLHQTWENIDQWSHQFTKLPTTSDRPE